PGYIRQGGTYYVYGNLSDGTGVDSVTANASNITSGQTNVSLTSGSYTVGGVTYGWRSASLTASSSLAAGSTTYSVTAADYAGNGATSSGLPVNVDNTTPTVDASVIGKSSGGTPGYIHQGGTYYIYANLTEAIGLDSDTASVTTITTGQGSVALVAGSYAVGGRAYGYRSA